MEIVLELPPQVEAMLRQEAERRGQSVAEILEQLLRMLTSDAEPDETFFAPTVEKKKQDTAEGEAILNDAVRAMKEHHVRNREVAVKAIALKNNLEAEVDRCERIVGGYERKARTELAGGNRELAMSLFQEMRQYDRQLIGLKKALATAVVASDRVKAGLRREETRIREQTAVAIEHQSATLQAEAFVVMEEVASLFDPLVTPDSPEEIEQAFADWIEKSEASSPIQSANAVLVLNEIAEMRRRLDELKAMLLQ